jgi:DNA topoisomerase-1
MYKLVIVESPGKIKKIKSFLGPGYIVMASVGHIRDLAKDSISVDPSNNFEPTYQIMSDKKKVVAGLKKIASTASDIIIAADGDREGEAIAQHLVVVLELKTNDYKRIVFHEITKAAINKALNSPRKVDLNMFNSQQTRRILDRIVGYKLSPILKSVPGLTTQSLGAGRVQSVVTRLIVDKEREIQNFINSDKSSTYNISGDFVINRIKFKATYIHTDIVDEQIQIKKIGDIIEQQEIESYKEVKSNIQTKDQIKIIVINIRSDPNFIISKITNTDRQRHPPQPFITSSLQQEASYKLKFQLKRTMGLAQKLYEKGLITYMRTDSPALSAEALGYIKKQILEDKAMGEDYYQFRQFKAKGQNAQEAHEAIRPTHFDVFDLTDYDLSGTDEEKLYQLIWNRTVASQMKSAKYHDQHIILSNKTNVKFEGTNSILVFDGYLKLYGEEGEIADNNEDLVNSQTKTHIKLNDQDLSKNNVSWTKINFKETFGSAPSRYNEPSLVKKLEGLGIGRPSTYAAIISKIQEHKYIRVGNVQGIEKNIMTYTLTNTDKKNQPPTFEKKASVQKIGNEKLRLIPTSDGEAVTDYLIKNFPQIMDYKFTARMETLLDDIAEGNKIWYEVLGEFYNVLKNQFSSLGLNIETSGFSKVKTNNSLIKDGSVSNSDNKNDEDCIDKETNSDSDAFVDTDDESNNIAKVAKQKKSSNNDSNTNPNLNPNSQIIGSHPKYGDITYMVTRYGPAFKVNLGGRSKKDLFVGASKLVPSDPNVLDSAIKFIDYKLQKSSGNNQTTTGKSKTYKKTNYKSK